MKYHLLVFMRFNFHNVIPDGTQMHTLMYVYIYIYIYINMRSFNKKYHRPTLEIFHIIRSIEKLQISR